MIFMTNASGFFDGSSSRANRVSLGMRRKLTTPRSFVFVFVQKILDRIDNIFANADGLNLSTVF